MKEPYTRAPHRRSAAPEEIPPKAALLIDFDNVTMAIRSNLGQEMRNLLNSDIIRGKVSVQRAYADWRRYPQYIVPLSEASIDLIFAPAYGSSKKNATDIRLAIDAMELVFTRPEIGTYILLSGDSDFSSLVLKLKEFGKYVIGVGLQESSSDLLVQNCDEYYSYNSLSGLTAAEELSSERQDPWELVEKAVKKMEERNDVMRSDRLKQVMLEIDGSFDEKDVGFSKFNRFLAEASSRGLVRIKKIGDGQYEVASVDGASAPDRGRGARAAEQKPKQKKQPKQQKAPSGREPRSETPSRGGGNGRKSRPAQATQADARRRDSEEGGGASAEFRADSLRDAYRLLQEVVAALSDDGRPVRDSEVKREILRRDENFDEAEFGFRKFSRFLRQAYDEEVVELTTDEDGNYHVSVAGVAPVSREAAPAEREEAPSEEPEREETAAAEARTREETGRAQAPPEATEAPAEEPRSEPDATEETRQEPEEEPAAASGGGRRRGIGHFGRRSRSDATAKGSSGPDAAELPGPVSTPDEAGDGGADEAEDATATARSEEKAGARGRRRRGLGRFRQGRRKAPDVDEEASSDGGGDQPPAPGPVDEAPSDAEPAVADEPEAEEEPAEPPTAQEEDEAVDEGATTAAGETPRDVDQSVEHMVRNYPGVGRKTAQALVEAFGSSVYDVIDEEPDRLTEVLPEHRARAVVEAREAERQETAT